MAPILQKNIPPSCCSSPFLEGQLLPYFHSLNKYEPHTIFLSYISYPSINFTSLAKPASTSPSTIEITRTSAITTHVEAAICFLATVTYNLRLNLAGRPGGIRTPNTRFWRPTL